MSVNESHTQLAERVREALIACAVGAHEDAGIRGLCCEGAWEAVVNALRGLDLGPVLAGATERVPCPPGTGGASR
jgi:hypothetical protein